MDVAVAGVKDVGDPQVVALADLGDVPEDVRQLGAGDDAVLGADSSGASRPMAPKAGLRLSRGLGARLSSCRPGADLAGALRSSRSRGSARVARRGPPRGRRPR